MIKEVGFPNEAKAYLGRINWEKILESKFENAPSKDKLPLNCKPKVIPDKEMWSF